jgi:site-specific DNA recombinase
MYVYNRCSAKNTVGTRNTHLYKDDEDIIFVEGGCPQIVPTDVFVKVQNKLTEHKHTGGRENAKECYLLSGEVFCRECSKAMVGNSRHSGRSKLLHVTYRCPSRKYICTSKEINRDYLEEYVLELIEKEILNSQALHMLRRAIEKYAEKAQIPTESQWQQELGEIDAAIKNVAEAIEAGLLTDVLVARLKELEKRKKELCNGTTSRGNGDKGIEIDVPTMLAEYKEVKSSPASPAYKEFIRSFIDRIDVGTYSVKITLKTGLDIFPALDTTYEVRRQEIYERKKTG